MLLRFFHCTQHVGEVIGKFLVFLTLPGTMIASYAYFDEITDYLLGPNVSVKIQKATLRCNYVFRDARSYSLYKAGVVSELTKNCRSSQVAVSFKIEIENRDSINRKLTELTIRAKIPPYGDLELKEVRLIDHLIQGSVETNIRREWHVKELGPNSTTKFEILAFEYTEDGYNDKSKNSWERFAIAMDRNKKEVWDSNIVIEIDAHFSGFFESTLTMLTCKFKLTQKEIDQWMSRFMHRRIQITKECS